jgi:hypothetical protein
VNGSGGSTDGSRSKDEIGWEKTSEFRVDAGVLLVELRWVLRLKSDSRLDEVDLVT